jgi:hypothetical protein
MRQLSRPDNSVPALTAERNVAGVEPGALPIAARRAAVGPVLTVALVLAWVLVPRLVAYHGNPTGFVRFGSSFVTYTSPPRDAILASPDGYDGQFFWVQASDPLLIKRSTVHRMNAPGQAFRMQRVAYPALAAVIAANQLAAIPWVLLLINVAVVLALAAAFAMRGARCGFAPAWAVALALLPGVLLGTLRDLSDPLALATMVGGLVLWQTGRRWTAAASLSVAVLAREPMVLAVAAVAGDAGWRAWRQQSWRVAALAWPVVLLPFAVFAAWQLYIDLRYGANVSGTASSPFSSPGQNVVDEVRHAIHADLGSGAWSLAYLTVMLVGMLASVLAVVRRVTAASLTAVLFAASLSFTTFGDAWSYGRLSAPMFAALLLDGLEQRRRGLLRLCVVAAAFSPLIPLTLRG